MLTQARDKNYVLPANDSLIRVAVDYYRRGKDREREMKSYFYLGCVYRDLDREPEAIDAYLETLEKIPDHDYSKFRKMVYGNLGLIYKKHGFYDKSIAISRKSYELCLQENDSANIIFPLQQIAHVFLFQNQVDSSLHYYQKALSIAEALTDSLTVSSLLSSISLAYTEKKDVVQAYRYVERAIHNTPSMVTMYDYYRKGNLLLEMNQLDSARYYLRQSLDNGDIYTQAASNLKLYEVEKKAHQYKEAIMYVDSYMFLGDSIDRKKHRSEITRLMNEHEIAMQTNQLKLKHQNIIIWFTTSFFCLLTVSLSIFMIINKRKKQLIIKLQQEVINSHAMLEELAQPQHEPTQDNAEPIPEQNSIFNRLLILVESFKQEDTFKDLYILKDLHKRSGIQIPSEKRNQFLHTLYSHFSDISSKAIKRYGLSDYDFLYCTLHLCNFPTAFIAAIMSVTPSTLRSRKCRMQKSELSKEFVRKVFGFNE